MTVRLIYRAPNPLYFSIERVFQLIRSRINGRVHIEESYASTGRAGFMGLIKNWFYFRKQTGDVFHITGDIHYAALAFPGRKVVLTIHDCIFLRHPSPVKRWLLKKLWLDWPVRHSRLVTTISEATKKDIVRGSGCSPDKVLVIPDPVDELFTYQPFNYNKECPVILQVGTWPNKNLERVIEALRGFHCELRIVGKLTDAQEAQLNAAGIHYTNGHQISQDKLISWYRQADMVMFATLFEGFGLPILEAQATGRPLITSNISPMSEVAGPGACLVDPFDIRSIRSAVEKIHLDPAYRNALVENGLRNIERFNAERIASSYLEIYSEVHSARG